MFRINEFDMPTSAPSTDEESPIWRIYRAFSMTYKDALQSYVNGNYESKDVFASEVLDLCGFAAAMYQAALDDPNLLKELENV